MFVDAVFGRLLPLQCTKARIVAPCEDSGPGDMSWQVVWVIQPAYACRFGRPCFEPMSAKTVNCYDTEEVRNDFPAP
jgi:hypothetical protein